MKKILSLIALLMLTMTSVWADDVATLTLNGDEVSDPAGFFTHDTNGKFSFNDKFKNAEYAGISFKKGLKMEGTTKILFTTTAVSKVTIVQSTWSSTSVNLDDQVLDPATAEAGTGCRIYTVTDVAAGEHSISRGSGSESGLFYVKVEWNLKKTVTFNNDANWEKVYVWAWNSEENFTGGTWPGEELTPNGEGIYTWSTTGNPTWLIFNDGSTQTEDLEFRDGGVYNSTGRVITLNNYSATFTTDAEWDEVWAYAWNDYETPLGDWPGTQMTLDGGKYTIAIEAEDAPKYIIFHNHEGVQTPDLAFVNGKDYEYMLNTYTATFTTDAAWENVYAYTWTTIGEGEEAQTTEYNGEWPGTALEAVDGVFTYTLKAFEAPAEIIFNNNEGEQTLNMPFTNGRAYKWNTTLQPLYKLDPSEEAIPAGTTVEVKNAEEEVVATLTFGVQGGKDFAAPTMKPNEEYAGFSAYTAGNGENGTADGGTVYIIKPKYDGEITAGVYLNGDKQFYITEDETALEGYNGIKRSYASSTGFTFPVKAESTYKIYCTGSKLGFYGFDYTYDKPEQPAEITKVQLLGDWNWDTATDNVTLEAGEAYAYSGVLDLTNTTDDQKFKLVINSDTEAQWIGVGHITVVADDGWISEEMGEWNDYILKNSTTGYQTYNITATWTPSADATANWTLAISGKDVREDKPQPKIEHLYIIGDTNNWDRSAMSEMTWNEENQAFEYIIDYTKTDCYFAFADYQPTSEEVAADKDWSTFNSTYRWAIAANDNEAEINKEYQLQKVNGTIFVPAGQYTVRVTKDMKMTILGEVAPPEPKPFSVKFINTSEWEEVYAYVWSGEDEAKVEQLGAWPGAKMTKEEANAAKAMIPAEQADVYTVEFTHEIDPEFIIFSNGKEGDDLKQTDDFAFVNEGEYTDEGPVDTWTIVGDANILGSAWGTDDTYNDMTVAEDGITYTLVKENVVLTAGNYPYKVVKNHSWNNENYGKDGVWGGDDALLTIEAPGVYTVTFTFVNDETHALSATAEMTATPTYVVAGWFIPFNQETETFDEEGVPAFFGTAWDPAAESNTMVLNSESGKYELTFTNAEIPSAGNITYKVVMNGDWNVAWGTDLGDDAYYWVGEEGVYNITFTFDPNTDTSEGAWPVSCEAERVGTGINAINADKAGFDASKPLYNVAGQRVGANYRGIVIQNGRRFILK